MCPLCPWPVQYLRGTCLPFTCYTKNAVQGRRQINGRVLSTFTWGNGHFQCQASCVPLYDTALLPTYRERVITTALSCPFAISWMLPRGRTTLVSFSWASLTPRMVRSRWIYCVSLPFCWPKKTRLLLVFVSFCSHLWSNWWWSKQFLEETPPRRSEKDLRGMLCLHYCRPHRKNVIIIQHNRQEKITPWEHAAATISHVCQPASFIHPVYQKSRDYWHKDLQRKHINTACNIY